MAGNKTVSIMVIGGGVIMVYLGYTGYLGNVWTAIKGGSPGTGTGTGNENGSPAIQPGTGPNSCPEGTEWDGKACFPKPVCQYPRVWVDGMCRQVGGGDVRQPLPTGATVRTSNAKGGQVLRPLPTGEMRVAPDAKGGNAIRHPRRTRTGGHVVYPLPTGALTTTTDRYN